MSTPPPISAPLRDANATSPALPPSRPGSPVGGFLLDVVMGVGILLALSLASSLVWGMWRGVEVVREAKQNGLPMPAGEARDHNSLPVGLAAGCVLTRDVAAGQKLSYADVTVDETRPIVAMRRLQDAMLANGTLGSR